MSALDIRPPREDELHEIVAIADLGFGFETPLEDEEALRSTFPFDRALCAYEAGRMIGTLAVYGMELTLPGRRAVPAGAATWGGTLPTHRRRGVLRSLFRAQLADMAQRGEPVSVLLASEAGIYGRFGYGAATRMMSFSIDRAYAGFADPPARKAPESITLVADVEAAARLAAAYESLRLQQPGALSRSAKWWAHYLRDPLTERQGATKMYHALHTLPDGTADGYVSYRIKDRWAEATPMFEVQVIELWAASPETYKALWDYIIGTDLCQIVSCHRGRVHEPLHWLLADSRRLTISAVADDLYVKLLDVPRALGAREYSAAGRLVIEVSEIFPEAGTRRYLLETGGIGAGTECAPTEREAELTVDTAALGAAYLGGVSFTTLAAAGRVAAAGPRALARADALFSSGTPPHCSTMF